MEGMPKQLCTLEFRQQAVEVIFAKEVEGLSAQQCRECLEVEYQPSSVCASKWMVSAKKSCNVSCIIWIWVKTRRRYWMPFLRRSSTRCCTIL